MVFDDSINQYDRKKCLDYFGVENPQLAYKRLGFRKWFNPIFLTPIIALGFIFLIGYYAVLLLGSQYEATATKIVDKMIFYYAVFLMIPLSAWATLSARYGNLRKYAWLYKTISDIRKVNKSRPN